MTRPLVFCVLLTSSLAFGASRPRYGGALEVGHVPTSSTAAPHLRDSPLEATLLQTEASPLCTLAGGTPKPLLATSITQTQPNQLRIVLRDHHAVHRHRAYVAAVVASDHAVHHVHRPGVVRERDRHAEQVAAALGT